MILINALLVTIFIWFVICGIIGIISYYLMVLKKPHSTQEIIEWEKAKGILSDAVLDLPWKKFSVKTHDGLQLSVQLINQNSENTIIFHHGFSSTWQSMTRYFMFFKNKGWNIVCFDSRAHGESEGKFPSFGVKEKLDLKEISNFVKRELTKTKVLGLYGESMGAATVLQAAPIIEDVNFVISDAAFSGAFEELEARLSSIHVPVLFRLGAKEFANILCILFSGFSLKEADSSKAIMCTSVPMLLFHGTADTFVPTYMSIGMHKKREQSHTTRLVLVKDAKHGTSVLTDPELYWKEVERFLNDDVFAKL